MAIRLKPVPPKDMPKPQGSGDGYRIGEKRGLSCDIGMGVCALLWDSEARRGGYLVISGGVDSYAGRADEYLDSTLRKLASMGSPVAKLECALFGGTATAKWQLDRTRKLLEQSGLSPQMLRDTLGNKYRTFAFDLNRGEIAVSHEEENPQHWSPAASALGIGDGNRIFSQSAVTGKVANATRFFREKKTFKGLRELVLPEFIQNGAQGPFKLWCAACSSGEEPYSYAMFLLRLRQRAGLNFPIRIFGTDINENCLLKAKAGSYDVPLNDINAYGPYFSKYGELDGQRVTFGPEVRSCVNFRPFDIRHRPRKQRFRMVVCANVFQYYNEEARLHFMKNFISVIEPPGYLFVNNVNRNTVASLGLEYLPHYGFIRVV